LKWNKNPPTRQIKIRQLAKLLQKKLVEQKDIHIFAASNTQNENL